MSSLGIVWRRDLAGYQNQEDKYDLFEVVGYADNSYVGDVDD